MMAQVGNSDWENYTTNNFVTFPELYDIYDLTINNSQSI